jgi:hypothetical protein
MAVLGIDSEIAIMADKADKAVNVVKFGNADAFKIEP